MKNLWVLLGVAAVVTSAGATAIRLSDSSAIKPASVAATPPTERQQMARLIAVTAARSAAQTTKILIANGGVDFYPNSPEATASPGASAAGNGR